MSTDLDAYVAEQERARAQRQQEMAALRDLTQQMERKQTTTQTPKIPPATVTPMQRVATINQPTGATTKTSSSHPSESRPSQRAASATSVRVTHQPALSSNPALSRPGSRKAVVEREVEEEVDSPPYVVSYASSTINEPITFTHTHADASVPTQQVAPQQRAASATARRATKRSSIVPTASQTESKAAPTASGSTEVSVARPAINHAPSASTPQTSESTSSKIPAPAIAGTPIVSSHPRPASSAAVVTTAATNSSSDVAPPPTRARATWKKPPIAAAAGPDASGRATVSGHFPVAHAAASSSTSKQTQSNPRAQSAAAIGRGKGSSAATENGHAVATAANTNNKQDEMTPAQRAAYTLRMQFLGTKVYVDPTEEKSKRTAAALPAFSPDRGTNAAITTAASASAVESSPSSSSSSIAPVRPDSRFLAPTVSFLHSAAPTAPSVEELLQAEMEASRIREAKSKAQRERMEKAKKELAKYKQELQEKAAREQEELARVEAESKAAEAKRLAAEKVRREQEKQRLALFQKDKQDRERTRLAIEAKRREDEVQERKKSVEAFLRTKAEQQAEQQQFEQKRLQELEERIQQLSAAGATVGEEQQSHGTTSAQQPKRARLIFPTPMPAAAPSSKPPHRPAVGSRVSIATRSAAVPVQHAPSVASVLSPPRQVPPSAAAVVMNTPSPSNLLSESISFFSSTTDVTQAFIAAQKAKDAAAAAGKTLSPAATGSGYAAIHASNTKPKRPTQRPHASNHAASSPVVAPPLTTLEAEIESEFASYDPEHFREEVDPSDDD